MAASNSRPHTSPCDDAKAPVAFDPQAARLARTAALDRAATSIRLVNDERAALLGRLGIKTVRDELYRIPRRFIDFTATRTIASVTVGEEATVLVTVDRVELKRPRPRMTVLELSCYDDTGVLMVSYFGQPWLAKQFKRGQRVALSGKMGFSYGFKRMNGPFHDLVQDAPQDGVPGEPARQRLGMLPVHATTEGLSQQWARRLVSCALETYGDVCDFWDARTRAYRI